VSEKKTVRGNKRRGGGVGDQEKIGKSQDTVAHIEGRLWKGGIP